MDQCGQFEGTQIGNPNMMRHWQATSCFRGVAATRNPRSCPAKSGRTASCISESQQKYHMHIFFSHAHGTALCPSAPTAFKSYTSTDNNYARAEIMDTSCSAFVVLAMWMNLPIQRSVVHSHTGVAPCACWICGRYGEKRVIDGGASETI